MLRVFFDFTPNVFNERNGFSEALSEECLEFVPSEGSDPVPLNLSLLLLSAEVDSISEEQGRKGDALVARGIGRVEMVFTLPTEVVTFHVWALIIQVGVTGLKNSLSGGGVCLAMILAFGKQF